MNYTVREILFFVYFFCIYIPFCPFIEIYKFFFTEEESNSGHTSGLGQGFAEIGKCFLVLFISILWTIFLLFFLAYYK